MTLTERGAKVACRLASSNPSDKDLMKLRSSRAAGKTPSQFQVCSFVRLPFSSRYPPPRRLRESLVARRSARRRRRAALKVSCLAQVPTFSGVRQSRGSILL